MPRIYVTSLEAIDHIESFLGGITFESYQNDLKTKSAVERQLQIITEATIRLGEYADIIAPGPDWEGFRRWETSCDTHITGSTTKLFGTPSRTNYRPCVRSF